jgi:F-type H+-transporting ATPase subunit b
MAAPAHASGNFLVPNATFFVEIIAFLVILWVFKRWVVPYVSRALDRRQEMIRSQIEESRRARERMEQAEAEYKRAQEQLRVELAAIREEAEQRARRTVEEARTRAQEEANRIAERAEAQLANERQRVFDELRGEIGRLAIDLAGRLVGESLADAALQRRVVDRFLDDLAGERRERIG